MMINDDFADRLKSHRKQKKKTQDFMAKMLNIRRSTYGEYERGKIKPPMEKVKILAEFFGVTTDYLIGIEEARTLDISKMILQMIDELENDTRAVVFEGEKLDKRTKELLISSLNNAFQTGKILRKVQDEKPIKQISKTKRV